MDPEALQTLSKVEGPVIKKASVKEGPVLQFNSAFYFCHLEITWQQPDPLTFLGLGFS